MTTRTASVANKAMYQWEERWRKKAEKHVEAHARLVIKERAEADRKHREQINAHHVRQRARLKQTHEAAAARAVHVPPKAAPPDADGAAAGWHAAGWWPSLESLPAVPGASRSMLRAPSEPSMHRTSGLGATEHPAAGLRVSSSSSALPRIDSHRADAVATPWTDQVKRLQTPMLASTRLSPSRGRARETASLRGPAHMQGAY